LRGHGKTVWSLGVSSDGDRVASGDSDGILKVWEATPPTAELRLRRQAGALVNGLAWEGMSKDEMMEHLRNDRDLSEPVRQQALKQGGGEQGGPLLLGSGARRVVFNPGAEAPGYRLALHRMEDARRLVVSRGDPDDDTCLSILGM